MNTFLSKFQRSTNSTNFIPEIDGLRFYAIITVVIFHLNTAYSKAVGLDDLGISQMGGKYNIWGLAWWIIRLDMGVKVFFAISGFVLALPFLSHYLKGANAVNLKMYFYRRLTRLEPPFIVSLVIFFFVHLFILNEPFSSLLPHLGVGLIYAHVFVYGYPSPINPVTWSLETEAQFYVLVPAFFALLFLKKNTRHYTLIFTLLFALSVVARFYITEYNYAYLSKSIIVFSSNFLTGIMVAWIYLTDKAFLYKRNSWWDIISLLSLFGMFYFYKPQHFVLNNLLFNLCAFIFIIGSFKGRASNWFFTRPFIYTVGGMCYSIYLLHYAFFHLVVKYIAQIDLFLGYEINLLLQFFLCVPLTLVVTAIFFLLFEKPFMDKNWPQKFKAFFSIIRK